MHESGIFLDSVVLLMLTGISEDLEPRPWSGPLENA